MKKGKLLFISHDATRTGAPILLLNLAEVLKEKYEITFLLKEGGILEERFKETAQTYLTSKKLRPIEKFKFFRKVVNKFLIKDAYKLQDIKWDHYNIIISNTITNGDILHDIRKYFTGNIISYVHELEMATTFFTHKTDLQKLLNATSAYLVPSIAVKQHLIKNLGIAEGKIQLLQYYIPAAKTTKVNKDRPDIFTVGSVGTSDWRKSPDLFILIAKHLFTVRPDANMRFIWKGAATHGVNMDRLDYDIKKCGLQNKITFVPSSANVDEFYAQMDVFLLTSREDPYPLVVLEAARFNCPTICFDDAGGAPEFVEASQSGHKSPYLDIADVVSKVLFYYDDPQALDVEGKNAEAKLKATHQDKKYIDEQFTAAVNKLLN